MLKTHELIKIWEIATSKQLWEKGVLMLAPAFPSESLDSLASLSLGKRNARLFRLREQVFGTVLNANSVCQQCLENIEFQLDSRVICDPGIVHDNQKEFSLVIEESVLNFRLVTSYDLRDMMSIVELEGPEFAEYELIKRCVISFTISGVAQPVESLPERLISLIADNIKVNDHHSEIICRLNCPECSHSWVEPFDIVKFFWSEIETKAQITLSEVQLLAKAFGWWEGDIISLSDVRRKYYLDSLHG